MHVVYAPYFSCDYEDMNSWSTEVFFMQNENIKHNCIVYLFASAKVCPLMFLFSGAKKILVDLLKASLISA